MKYICIDLGTSAVKNYPHPGWSEHDPDSSCKAVIDGMRELAGAANLSDVAAIGCAGRCKGLSRSTETEG